MFLIKINLFFETLLLNYENKTKILHYQSLTMTCKIFGRDSLNNKDPFFVTKAVFCLCQSISNQNIMSCLSLIKSKSIDGFFSKKQ